MITLHNEILQRIKIETYPRHDRKENEPNSFGSDT